MGLGWGPNPGQVQARFSPPLGAGARLLKKSILYKKLLFGSVDKRDGQILLIFGASRVGWGWGPNPSQVQARFSPPLGPSARLLKKSILYKKLLFGSVDKRDG